MAHDFRTGSYRIFNRYYFLEPNVKVKLPVLMNKMLNYSAPCLLSAICIPVIF
ncbi:hypothetical protein BANRA_03736 [Acinetobacter baumannii]|nr:hypothetical protein BANRA_03736 [Acinetobacter baumannii]